MTIASTKPVGQQVAILRTHEDTAHEIQNGQIQGVKKRPLNRKNLRSAKGDFDALWDDCGSGIRFRMRRRGELWAAAMPLFVGKDSSLFFE